MALINVNLDEAEQKLVDAVTQVVLPQIKSDILNTIIPAIQQAVDGLHVDVKLTFDVSKKQEVS